MSKIINDQEDRAGNHSVILDGVSIGTLTESDIARHASNGVYFDLKAHQHINPSKIGLGYGTFTNQFAGFAFPQVSVSQQQNVLSLSCSCYAEGGRLCEHQALVLNALIRNDELRLFFDDKLRHERLKIFATDYGLQNERDLDAFFQINYHNKKAVISPRSKALTPVTRESIYALNEIIVPLTEPQLQTTGSEDSKVFIVLKEHKYYKYLFIELYKAQTTKEGKVKNPCTLLPPLDFVWGVEDAAELKFYAAVNKFQNHLNAKKTEADIIALRAIVKNPVGYDFYQHLPEMSDKVTSTAVYPVKVRLLPAGSLVLNVNIKDQFYEIKATLGINGNTYLLKDFVVRYTYFVNIRDIFYLVDNLQVLNVVELLKSKPEGLWIHQTKFGEFKSQWLSKLEDTITVKYHYIEPATQAQLKQQGFTNEAEKIIYLSDFGMHVMIIPVMRYGEMEISIRTRRLIYAMDEKGKQFVVKRDDAAEVEFTSLLIKQHPYFAEQLNDDLHYFYLHKRHFLDENWFLNVFDEWQNHNITIHGFNELEGNKLNPNKVKINIKVLSGINWFNALVNVSFGNRKASLKHMHRAVKNKSRYVQLDDGSMGIMPADWLEKFAEYFNSAEIADDDTLRIPKINFATIAQLYDAEMLDDGVKHELNVYNKKLNNFDSIKDIPPPAELNATLRHYQQDGLNWLNFLDEFNFGGCLADDMGLGKSLQIIAFILSQRERVIRNTNLIVVPTSLIFNWQQEVAKFAPTIRIHTIYGADRIKNTEDFNRYEIILTSYGTLLSDINFIKDYHFNYVFLDESQNIKNPESQRYKTVRLLKSRNKIAITGTPIENNTFDLYGQLSFACPGLLGSKQYFKDIYSTPIDQFKYSKRAAELQAKIKPFILRRTKQQVATELPEKTEMVLYCEMSREQKDIYDAYEKEFREYISATNNDELKKSSMNVLKGLTKLRQICDSPLLLSGDKLPGNASAKIDMLIEQIEEKHANHKILVFSQFVGMLDLIKKELTAKGIGFSYLTGQTRNREAVVNDFQTNPATRVFLISLKAGGTGLNLTQADYVYLVDPWWNPAVENQAIDRCHRIGQDKHIMAVRLICPDTVEEKIMELQQAKRDLANDLIRTDSSFIKSLSKDDLLGLVS
ncbi:DEAD/DEAH box helicase [Mucilaginibacter agri]|uniref:DEAD/DEAH box helicase family protein n=1 Tax=Mucilaginibacter agri TaxID=2695265 RepID=A0A965ZLR8_9SPHI|nr:DEAD/DEAH box helicase [Mucilaginibacter agri]NCD72269.1 DEAD/DEAH box helicase family protein [Mucilaginibacter agri]